MAEKRADARRNYARVLTVAEEEVATYGPSASLEQIARIAGVGSATVRRHFPTRRALLEAVSLRRIAVLCARAEELTAGEDSRAALLDWLGDVVAYCVTARGLAEAIAYTGDTHDNGCSRALEDAAGPLLRRAVDDGAVRAGVTVEDLIALAVGITLATEHYPDPGSQANRLLQLAVSGFSPSP